jgi:dihydrofolate synthase / folylpolyglutamate synthase
MTDDYAAVQRYLAGLKAQGVHPGLQRIEQLTTALGHPERVTPCVHVAGTNGKGSVAAMLEAILRASGWRTGLYTSPHLVRLGERLQVNRRPATPEQIVARTHELRATVESLVAAGHARPSYFEFMTAMAFVHFAREACDIAVIETGMGGRLDATNVVTPEVSVITSVGLDHCAYLGDTHEQIAAEKAGIIKPGRPAVIGLLPAGAEHVVRTIAAERGSPVIAVRDHFGADPARLPATNLHGEHQRTNAATAVLTARTLGPRWRITPETTTTALRHVDWPGRWQRLRAAGRDVFLEAAHNADGARALDRNLAQLQADTGRAPIVVVGALGATRARPLLETICRHAQEIHLVVPRQARACSHAELEALAPPACRDRLRRASVEALFPGPDGCTAGEPGEPVVVTGSLYLVGEVLARLEPDRGPLEDALQDF